MSDNIEDAIKSLRKEEKRLKEIELESNEAFQRRDVVKFCLKELNEYMSETGGLI
jgi:hypothetical protein